MENPGDTRGGMDTKRCVSMHACGAETVHACENSRKLHTEQQPHRKKHRL